MDKTCEHCRYWRYETDDVCCCPESPHYEEPVEEDMTCRCFWEDEDG